MPTRPAPPQPRAAGDVPCLDAVLCRLPERLAGFEGQDPGDLVSVGKQPAAAINPFAGPIILPRILPTILPMILPPGLPWSVPVAMSGHDGPHRLCRRMCSYGRSIAPRDGGVS
jgi:hypothetical protein